MKINCKFKSHGQFCTHKENPDIRSRTNSNHVRNQKRCLEQFCPLKYKDLNSNCSSLKHDNGNKEEDSK